MNIIRNILAVVVGVVLGGIINMSLITWGSEIVPPPPGVDVSDPESIGASIHLFSAKHFLVPFLAHASGTFVGALAAYFIASSHKAAFAYVIGGVFLAGGIAASFMIPAPTWYIITDLVAAYIPMSWLAANLGARKISA